MVFMGKRGAEEGKDAVASGLHDEALIAVDGVHHQLQGGIDEAAGGFGVEVFNERGGVLDIGKQRGDGLALAIRDTTGFQRRLLGPNALGQMRGRIADGRRSWWS